MTSQTHALELESGKEIMFALKEIFWEPNPECVSRTFLHQCMLAAYFVRVCRYLTLGAAYHKLTSILMSYPIGEPIHE